MWTFWIEFALLLTAILIGIRRGGVALGMIGGLGVAVMAFVFRVAPAEPPITVMLIILAVVTASATLQVAGGLDFLVQQAERLMRRHPQQITFLAPLSTFLLTMCVGTGHAVYSLLPVIADVSLKTKIRPERPMAMASVASQMGITASPAAAAVTTLLALTAKSGQPLSLWQILIVTIPAGLVGVLAAAFWSLRRGAELDQDPEYQARLLDPDFRASIEKSVTTLDKTLPAHAKPAVVLFFSGILLVVLLALFPHWLPLDGKGKPVPMTTAVQFVMLAFGAFILFLSNAKAAVIARSEVFTAGMIAVVSIFGIAWMSDTFVKANEAFLVDNIKVMVAYAPWTFALAMFAVSAFVKSQAATLTIMVPFGLALGLTPHQLLAIMPSCYAYFFFAFYPSDLAAINMDRSGTTRIGKYLLNHSFMMPGLIGVGVSTVAAYALTHFYF
ncbi:Anaerobic C4-dicarboxylate transporter [Chromobacterium violaceum]|uniref:anaerobic C4-dicarboxylate transporter n=1 Tax=Chromobacterium violaceum TaxID=536 RepID=UPI0005D383D6|nr:anaerobic C4-dicarboxylate transporter [Chromobacterium violaceum]KJH66985.1 C4-dicarboxylate transporter [Chromobacterium violaceum]MCD0494211.1 anaerobic C4-dicarboxylate transporter [Chromobacterium violaceum]